MADPVTAADTVAGLVSVKAWSFAEFILKYQIMHAVVAGVSAAATAVYARHNLEKGRVSKYRTPHNGTEYIRLAGRTNPATGNEYVLQQIRKEGKTFDLRDVFDPKYRSEIIKYINKAAALDMPNRPFVLERLKYVVPPEKYERVLEQISRDIMNHAAPENGVKRGSMGSQYYEELDVYHLLVFEQTAEKGQYKFVTIDSSMLEEERFPDLDDVVVEGEGKLYKGKEHYFGDRWHTNKELIRGVRLDIDGLYSRFKVGEKTGRILHVETDPIFSEFEISAPQAAMS